MITDNEYILVQWPESQELMEKEWFQEEAILAIGYEDKTGSFAYFVPKHRVHNQWSLFEEWMRKLQVPQVLTNELVESILQEAAEL